MKHSFWAVLFIFLAGCAGTNPLPRGAQQTILGGTGVTWGDERAKINANFTELYARPYTDRTIGFADTDSNWTAAYVGTALEEMDDSINGGVPNSATYKVHWSQLGGVPAGFADGTDDGSTGGTTFPASDGNRYVALNGAWVSITGLFQGASSYLDTLSAGGASGSYVGTSAAGVFGYHPLPAGSVPGGTTTQFQYNDGGVFAGNAGATFNKTTGAATFGGTVTAGASLADGTKYIFAGNGVAITAPVTAGGLSYYNGRWWVANGTNWITRKLSEPDSADTLTNKTVDMAGTGNNFTVPYDLPTTLVNPADTDDPLIDKVKRATILTGMDCIALGGGTISVDVQECNANGASCVTTGATVAACGTTNTNDVTFSNADIAVNNTLKLAIVSISGTVSQVIVKVYGTQVW